MIYTLTLNPAVDRELTVAAIEFDNVLRAERWQVDFGGKGFNVSRMLMSLGTPSTALGFAGGRSGEMLRAGLEALGIETDFVWITAETRTNISIVTHAHDRYIKVNEPGPTIDDAQLAALLAQVRRLAGPDDWWVLAGSLPPGVPASVYAELTTIIQAAGGRVVLDTSGAALAAGCRAKPYLIKPNHHEAAALTKMPVETLAEKAAAARAIQALGVMNIVMSLGKEGALLLDGSDAWLATGPAIFERNPIGAGDALVGGLVWGLNQGKPLVEAIRWGIASGAATASRSGTAVAERADVAEMSARVSLTPI